MNIIKKTRIIKKRIFKEACVKGNLEKVKEMYSNNFNINQALQWASENGQLKVVQFLVENGADINAYDAFAWASRNGHLEVLKYLVEKGVNVHVNTNLAFRSALRNGHLEVIKYLVEKSDDIHIFQKVFIWAIQYSQIEIVKYLVETGVDIHVNNDCAIIWALYFENLEIIQFLAWKGADLNKIQDPKMKEKIQEYVRLRKVYQECMTRIHFHPELERTKTENLEKFMYVKIKKIKNNNK